MKDRYIKAFQEFQDGCAHEIDFTDSEEYRESEKEINKLFEQINTFLGDKGPFLIDLQDQFSGQIGVIQRISYKKGFAAAVQLIFFHLLS